MTETQKTRRGHGHSSSDSEESDIDRASRLARERKKLEEQKKAIIRQRVAQSSNKPVQVDLLASILPSGSIPGTSTKDLKSGTLSQPTPLASRMVVPTPAKKPKMEVLNSVYAPLLEHEQEAPSYVEEDRPKTPECSINSILDDVIKKEQAKAEYELKSYVSKDEEENKDINNPEWEALKAIKTDQER